MRWIIAVIATLVTLGAYAAQPRAAVGRRWAPFVLPGATDVTVEVSGHGAWHLRYQASDLPAHWYATLAQKLEAQGWTSRDQTAYAPLNRSYSRATSLGVATMREWAWFSLDPVHPQKVHIDVQRAVDVPWWRQLKRLVASATKHTAPVPLLPSADV